MKLKAWHWIVLAVAAVLVAIYLAERSRRTSSKATYEVIAPAAGPGIAPPPGTHWVNRGEVGYNSGQVRWVAVHNSVADSDLDSLMAGSYTDGRGVDLSKIDFFN